MSLDGSHMAIVKLLARANHAHTWWYNMSVLFVVCCCLVLYKVLNAGFIQMKCHSFVHVCPPGFSLLLQIITVNAMLFPTSVANSLIAVGTDGLQERDRMVRAAIAIVCELGECERESWVSVRERAG